MNSIFKKLGGRKLPVGLALAFLAAPGAFGQVSVLTYHNDQARDGWNPSETILTTSNVNQAAFGKLFSNAVDGQVYGQPLYVPNLSISGGTHNVVYVVTEHDSAYAFDADSAGVTYWHVNFLNAATTLISVPSADVAGCPQITPEIGITDTPVLDPATGTIYFVAMTEQRLAGPVTNYYQQLHALDITTGAEKFNGPVTIQAVDPQNASVTFIAHAQKERCALTLVNGVVYTAWSSHCDFNNWGPYHGWVIGYNASNISQQISVYDTAPNGTNPEASLWESGDGPSVDSAGNLYFLTGNGTLDQTAPVSDYGQCFLKLNTTGNAVTVLDYFSPMNEATLSGGDQDIGSAGQCLLPTSWGSVAHPNLVIGADKPGDLYVVDTVNMGHFSPTMNNIPQMVVSIGGSGFTTPAIYSNGVTNYVYWGMTGHTLKSYTFANGLYVTPFSSQSALSYGAQGTQPSVSSNGNTNGIVWTLQSGTPLVLHAYDATTLATELYNSSQAAANRDSAVGAYVKFTTASIVQGKVYVPTGNSLVVYGLLATPTPTPTGSPTLTATRTATSSPTSTPTLTPTNTLSSTVTSSPTPSPTQTPTNSPTSTSTNTSTPSPSSTPTLTPSKTPTNSPTATPTLTPSNTLSPTVTSSATPSPTQTPTNSPTSTPTLTPTNTLSPTVTSSATPSPTLSPTGTLTPTHSPSATNSPTTTPTLTPSPTPTNPFSPTDSMTPTASLTATPSYTNSGTASPTPTSTPTKTLTLTATFTLTASITPTLPPTSTPTTSLTPASTPPVTSKPVIYPNPVRSGNTMNLVLTLADSTSVNLRIFTVAFRKVLDETTAVLPAGVNNLSVPLVDKTGTPLANGLYYLVVTVDGKRTILKLLVEK